MKTVSIEYCHISSEEDRDVIIARANEITPKILDMFKDYEIQKCIMLDDVYAKVEINDETIKDIISKLKVKPDCIYLESSFASKGYQVIDKIDLNERDMLHSNKEIWVKESIKKYHTTNSFMIASEDKDDTLRFSCPTLTAVSYLCRLGLLDDKEIKTIYGEKIKKADYLVNILSSYYLQIEDKAQSIIEATYPEALRKISWYLY